MFIESIKVVETVRCQAAEGKFRSMTRVSVSLNELLPYLNSVVDKPNYQPSSNSLIFKKGVIGFILKDTQITVMRYGNMTELYELLDWVKDLINDVYERRDEIVPNHTAKKIVPAMQIYMLLPKTNCRKCGENTCMAFAAKMNKSDAVIEECSVLDEERYAAQKNKLVKITQ